MTRQIKKKFHSETKSIPSISNPLIQYYYSPLYGGIHTIRSTDPLVLSYPCRFLNDAATCLSTAKVSKKYFKSLVLLDLEKLESYDFLTVVVLTDFYKPYAVKHEFDKTADFFDDYKDLTL